MFLMSTRSSHDDMAGRARIIRWLVSKDDQSAFAEGLPGVSRETWNMIENGKRRFSARVALAIERKYGITPRYLWDGETAHLNGALGRSIQAWSGPPPPLLRPRSGGKGRKEEMSH